MRKGLIVLTILVAGLAPATPAFAVWTGVPARPLTNGRGPCSDSRYRIERGMALSKIVDRNRALIRCAFTWAGIPGQIPMAQYVANRESHYIPWATNPWVASACHPWSWNSYGSCGTFQHLSRYWDDRVRLYMKPWWMPHRWPTINPRNERANALVTAQMVKHGGWGPWACSC